jgi:hypothetical protein
MHTLLRHCIGRDSNPHLTQAIELGASTLFVDEDTCATNFMIRDRKMQVACLPLRSDILHASMHKWVTTTAQMLVAVEQEPITPFLSKVNHVSASIVLLAPFQLLLDPSGAEHEHRFRDQQYHRYRWVGGVLRRR